MYDFFLYSSSSSKIKWTGCNVVMKLLETLPRGENCKLSFDDWFCILGLLLQLKEIKIFTTATVWMNRTKGCPLIAAKDLKKQGRGISCYMVDLNSGVIVLRWFYKKCVQTATTYADPIDIQTFQIWDRVSEKHIQTTCPSVIKQYNSSMGGVDLADMLIALYRTEIKCKRCYLKIFFPLD